MSGNLFCGFLMSNLAASSGNSFVCSCLTTEVCCSPWEEALLWPCWLEAELPVSPSDPQHQPQKPGLSQSPSFSTRYRVSQTSCLEVPQRAELQLDGQRGILAVGLPGEQLCWHWAPLWQQALPWQMAWAQRSLPCPPGPILGHVPGQLRPGEAESWFCLAQYYSIPSSCFCPGSFLGSSKM